METSERVAGIIAALKQEYPDALCALHYGKDYELMIAVRLSAQCTDARVNLVTPALFARYPTLDAFAEADVAEVEGYVHSCGFYKHKAEDIVLACRMLRDEYGGKVPGTMEQLLRLPGVGRKTAMRLVLHLLRQDTAVVEAFGNAIVTLKHEVKYCKVCHNISDTETCRICSNPQRDSSVICVVENIRDVMAVEATQQFRGLYHVLGGVISPMDGIGPGDLEIESLVQRVSAEGIKEVVLALSTTMEGDTTNFYIYRKLEKLGVKLSVIARGISVGDELEYADEVTLGRSIVNRTPFTGTV